MFESIDTDVSITSKEYHSLRLLMPQRKSLEKQRSNAKAIMTKTRTPTREHRYWVKWNSESSNARTLFRGRTDQWAQLQAGTSNLGFYGDRDGAFRNSGLDVNSPSGMWQR